MFLLKLTKYFLFIGCISSFANSELGIRQFFENSLRGDATQEEANWTAKVKGCAAFFLETDNGSVMMASARHCFSYSITNWCNRDGRITRNDGAVGYCKSIIAADSEYDIAVFEADFDSAPNPENRLKLASFWPPLYSKLLMVGYPADKFRQAKLTTTRECWVLLEDTASPHSSSNLKDRSGLHNCTTYGGNSGGPMVLENTNVALALPFTYAPGNYVLRDPWNLSTASHLAKMSGFVARNRAKLEQAGISIADEVPEETLYVER